MDASGFKEAPFRSRQKVLLCVHKTKTGASSESLRWKLLAPPTIYSGQSGTTTMILRFELPHAGWEAGRPLKRSAYLGAHRMTRAALHTSWRVRLFTLQHPVQPHRQFARHHHLGRRRCALCCTASGRRALTLDRSRAAVCPASTSKVRSSVLPCLLIGPAVAASRWNVPAESVPGNWSTAGCARNARPGPPPAQRPAP